MKKPPSTSASSNTHEEEALVARELLYAQKKVPKNIFQFVHKAGEEPVRLDDVRRGIECDKRMFRIHLGLLLSKGFLERRRERGTGLTILTIGKQITDAVLRELLTPACEDAVPTDSMPQKNHKISFLRQRAAARNALEKSLGAPLSEFIRRAREGDIDARS